MKLRASQAPLRCLALAVLLPFLLAAEGGKPGSEAEDATPESIWVGDLVRSRVEYRLDGRTGLESGPREDLDLWLAWNATVEPEFLLDLVRRVAFGRGSDEGQRLSLASGSLMVTGTPDDRQRARRAVERLRAVLRSLSPTVVELELDLVACDPSVALGTFVPDSGGEERVFGTLIGALIIAVIQNGLNMAGVKSYEQKVIFGLLILTAVLLDQLKKRAWKSGT